MVREYRPEPEECCVCNAYTGKAGPGDGSLYTDEGAGPFCEECYAKRCPLPEVKEERQP